MKAFILGLSLAFLLGCSVKQEIESKSKTETELPLARYKELADSCYDRDSYKLAIEYFDRVIEIDSLNGELFYKRGFSLAKMNDFENSSMNFLKAIEYGYRISDAYYMLGMNQIPSLNDSIAVFYFEKSLELNPNAQETVDAMNACKRRLNRPIAKKSSTI